LLLTVLSTVMAFHWMNVYQPRIPASRAALIYLLEPVFGSFFSICMGLDPLSSNLVIGGGLILGGNFLVELPAWLRMRNSV
jgi:drug/metabolite transporter (DMT)-like permease